MLTRVAMLILAFIAFKNMVGTSKLIHAFDNMCEKVLGDKHGP